MPQRSWGFCLGTGKFCIMATIFPLPPVDPPIPLFKGHTSIGSGEIKSGISHFHRPTHSREATPRVPWPLCQDMLRIWITDGKRLALANHPLKELHGWQPEVGKATSQAVSPRCHWLWPQPSYTCAQIPARAEGSSSLGRRRGRGEQAGPRVQE